MGQGMTATCSICDSAAVSLDLELDVVDIEALIDSLRVHRLLKWPSVSARSAYKL